MNDSKFNAKTEIEKENLTARVTKRPQEASYCTSNRDTIYLRRSGFAFCPVCEKLVELLSFAASAELFRTDIKDIESLAKSGELHRIHNPKAEVLICTDSLFRCFDARQTRLLDSNFEEGVRKA